MRQTLRWLAGAGAVLAISGCALVGPTVDEGGLAELRGATSTRPLQLAVWQANPDFHVKGLGAISSEPAPENKAEETAQLKTRLEQVRAEIDSDMLNAVRKSPYPRSVSVPSADSVDVVEIDQDNSIIPAEVLARLRSELGADALFRYRVVGYGSSPEEHTFWYTAATVSWITGVTAVAYSNPKTRPFIGAYLLSEVLGEALAAYLGNYGVNHFLKPVTIEGELIDLKTGKTLWSDSVTDYAWGRLRESSEEKLMRSTQRTIRDLSGSLDAALAISE